MMNDDESMDPGTKQRMRAMLVREAVSVSRPRETRAWPAALVATAAAVAVIGGGVLLTPRAATPEAVPTTDVMTAVCGNGVVAVGATGEIAVADGIPISVAGGAGAEERLLQACGDLWRDGEMALSVEFQNSTGPQNATGLTEGGLTENVAVPALRICEVDTGLVVVPHTTCAAFRALLDSP